MKFNSAFLLAGSASSVAGCGGGFLDLSSATDIANSMAAARGGGSSGGLRSAIVVAGAHPYQHNFVASAHHGGGTVASAIIGRTISMDNNMVMVQGELKREVRRQTNDQLSRLLQDAEDAVTDTTESTTGEEDEVDDEEIAVLYMGGLTEISDRVRGWFANREDSSSGEAGGSSASSAGGLRNWFQDRQANQGST